MSTETGDTVTFKVDFNNRRHGRIVASLRYASGARIPDVGDQVELYDDEGNGCSGEVTHVEGRAVVEIAPDWRTWRRTTVTIAPDWRTWRRNIPERNHG